MDSQNNLLVRLHKWAVRQDENFVTEAFAFLLQYLVEYEPSAAAGLLKSMTSGFFNLKPEEARAVTVRTQIVTGEGTPDVSLQTEGRLAYIEIKLESEPSAAQLRKYRQLLAKCGIQHTLLILLTRHVIDIQEDVMQCVSHIRWYQVADWLQNERSQYAFKAVSGFLVDQFLGLLGVKGMTMAQVTWELPGGIRALRNFLNMLEEAAHVAGMKVKAYGDKDQAGVSLDKDNYAVFINYDDPDRLTFQTSKRVVSPNAAELLGVGYDYERSDKQGHGWGRDLELNAEDVHFYSRPRAGQMQLLEAFIRESMNLARRVELPSHVAPKADEAEPEPIRG